MTVCEPIYGVSVYLEARWDCIECNQPQQSAYQDNASIHTCTCGRDYCIVWRGNYPEIDTPHKRKKYRIAQ